MTSSADLSSELVAYERGELDPATAERVERALAESPDLAAELEEIRSVLALVRSVGDLEPSAAASERLGSALDIALAENPGPAGAPVLRLDSFRARARRAWDYAQWRYENSSGVRRFVTASIVAHAAALACVAVLLVQEVQRKDVRVAFNYPEPVDPFRGEKPDESLDEHLPRPVPGEELDLDSTEALEQGYRASLREIAESEARMEQVSEARAMVESFLLGGRVIGQLGLDPLLPEPLVDTEPRWALVQAMRELLSAA